LIGCGQIKPHRDGSRELASIAVQKGWRRQGIAAAIIQRLLADEPPPVWLTCMDRLVPFYEQFGFVEVKDGDGRSLPRTFRFIRTIFKPIQKLSRIPGYLAIMVWPSRIADSRRPLIVHFRVIRVHPRPIRFGDWTSCGKIPPIPL
jgi:GNAT superfamily N-acetyltransferase